MGQLKLSILYAVGSLVIATTLMGCTTGLTDAGPNISLERSACYGACPVYRFTLYANGRYVWEGRSHVAVMGTVRGRMNARAYVDAMQLLKDTHYLQFKDSYATEQECEIFTTDRPGVQIVVADISRPKTIYHYLGCEGFAERTALTQLENDLDKVMKTRRFTGERSKH